MGQRYICPHCAARLTIKFTKPQTELTRIANAQCTNVECGATYRITNEITQQLSPSGCPNPRVLASLSQRGNKDQITKHKEKS